MKEELTRIGYILIYYHTTHAGPFIANERHPSPAAFFYITKTFLSTRQFITPGKI